MEKKESRLLALLNRIQPKHYPVLAFILTALTYAMAFSCKQMLGNGQYTIIRGDLDFQFIPFIRQFCRVLKGEHSYWFSWSNGLGDETALLYAYYTLSPFNLFYLIFGEGRELTATALVVILKPALAAACFQVYITKLLRKRHLGFVLFSMAYALCGFSVCYYFDIIWMDALYMLPVICIGLLKLFREKKPGLLLFSYAYLLIVNFYMGYIVGVSTFVIFLCYAAYRADRQPKKELAGIFGRYIITVVISGMISAAVLLPAAIQLFSNGGGGEEGFLMYPTNPLFLLNNLFIGEFQSLFCYTAYIYTGLFTAILLPFFFLNRKIGKRKRIFLGICLLFFVLACLIKPLNMLMHAFDSPGQQAYRFSFVISFLLATAGCMQFPYLGKIGGKKLLIAGGAALAVYLISFFLYPLVYPNAGEVNSNCLLYGIFNAAIFAAWALLILFFRKKERKTEAYLLLFLLFAAETVLNFGLCIDRAKLKQDDQMLYEEIAQLKRDEVKEVRAEKKEDFYRINLLESASENQGMNYDINGISCFSSSDHRATMELLSKLGMYRGIHYRAGVGMTPVMRGLLGVRYEINANQIEYTYSPEDIAGPAVVGLMSVENPYALPLGFMVSDETEGYTSGDSPFENQESLLSLMTGEETDCFTKIPVTMTAEHGKISCDEDGITYLIHDGDTTEDAVYTYFADSSGLPLYAYLKQDRLYDVTGGIRQPVIKTEDLTDIYEQKTLDVTFVPARVFRVGENADGQYEFRILLSEELGSDYYRKAYFSVFHEEEWEKAYRSLSERRFEIECLRDGYVSGTADAGEGEILFTTIPYSEGWSARIDGREAKITPLLEGAFIGVMTGEGEHRVELIYEAPGKKAGILISTAGILLALIYGRFFTMFSKKSKIVAL